ncbi:MAG: hypothetical protein V2I67_11670 [Thermoanaerobaculales bacterium]|jgi:hypothetical protein|nr:hypothetical protein [Thermoanaerobaculales bacterium]
MTLYRSTLIAPSRPARLIVAALTVAVAAVTAQAQTVEWRVVDNPYQEDVAYTIGDTFNPGVIVDGMRWHSFMVAAPSDLFTEGETVETEVTVVFENRRSKSAKVLAILLLEDADGNPLDRVQIPPFKVGGDRRKERAETVELAGSVINATERVYLFFEILQ